MINNILAIKSLLHFQSEDDFYHLQILKRKKEHPELGSNSYVVKTYYIRSVEYLEKEISGDSVVVRVSRCSSVHQSQRSFFRAHSFSNT